MKKIILLMVLVFLGLTFVNANENFKNDLDDISYSYEDISNQDSISRFEIIILGNKSQWFNCKVPPQDFENAKSWLMEDFAEEYPDTSEQIENNQLRKNCVLRSFEDWVLDEIVEEINNNNWIWWYNNATYEDVLILAESIEEWLSEQLENNFFGQVDNYEELISWEEAITAFGRIYNNLGSEFVLDYSWDGVKNHLDNCPYEYNPSQRDTSWDGVWDVCSTDISGDGNTHPEWIINYQWNISYDVLDESDAVCPFDDHSEVDIPAEASEGDISNCPNTLLQENISLDINTDKITWDLDLQVEFEAEYEGNPSYIEWDFGNGDYQEGEEIVYTYTEEWIYTVTATAHFPYYNKTLTASKVISAVDKDSYVYLGIDCDYEDSAEVEIYCEPSYNGNINEIEWSAYSTDTLSPDQSFQDTIEEDWVYTVNADAKDINWNTVAQATSSLNVTNQEVQNISNLEVEDYIVNLWDGMEVSVDWELPAPDNIEEIIWNSDETSAVSTDSLTRLFVFDESEWSKYIKQTSYLGEDSYLESLATIYAKDPMKDISSSLEVKADETKTVWEEIEFEIISEGFEQEHIEKIRREFGDGNNVTIKGTDQAPDAQENPMSTSWSYNSSWSYEVKAYIFIEDWEDIINKTSVNIEGEGICEWDISQYQCDTSGDGIPDICSSDISWDGLENFVGIISEEPDNVDDPQNCEYSEEHLDKEVLKQQHKMANKFPDTYDMCPFENNPDPVDTEWDGVGEGCEYDFDLETESQIDNIDIPSVPEIQPNLEVTNVYSCPAHYADYDALLRDGDHIRISLFDEDGEEVYTSSAVHQIDSIMDN